MKNSENALILRLATSTIHRLQTTDLKNYTRIHTRVHLEKLRPLKKKLKIKIIQLKLLSNK